MTTSSTPPLIEVRNVEKHLGGKRILDNISFNVAAGSTCCILGGSGMGKSVLMKHMVGLMRPDSGSVVIDGKDLASLNADDAKKMVRNFGVVFQNAALFDSMSVFDNVAFPLREHLALSRDEVINKVHEKLRLFSLDPDVVNKRFPAEISGGMRKRVALARAVALEPKILFYDEPTTGLDPITTEQVDALISHARETLGVTSVIISHDVVSALRLADHMVFIYEGRVAACDVPSTVLSSTDPYVRRFFEMWRRGIDEGARYLSA